MQLLLLHPEVAYRSCEDCKKYVYDHETGVREEFPEGSGNPVLRPKGMLPPCSMGPTACAKVSPESEIELNERNQLVYYNYRIFRTVGKFPDDSWTWATAEIIKNIEDQVERIERQELTTLIKSLILRASVNG